MNFRIEKDSLGDVKVPTSALYGAQTQRAIENFTISGIRQLTVFIQAFVFIKKSAAIVNMELALLNKKIGEAIVQACDEILEGKHLDQFVVDVYQAGAGTSHNMNTNEVLCNRAIEILGGQKGDFSVVHPNDHVNMAQSTNDTIPTAIRLSALLLNRPFQESAHKLVRSLSLQGEKNHDVVMTGRTHLQDAVPITAGQVFLGWSDSLKDAVEKVEQASDWLKRLPIGGTAVGTGMNSHPQYHAMMVKELNKLTGLDLKESDNLVELISSLNDVANYSAAIKGVALELMRISNDIRLYSAGPNTGIDEFHLPPVQPGSSIMPGKVNPVMCEMMNQVCYQVIGLDTTVSMASQAGQFQLNVMMPVIQFNLLFEITILTSAMKQFSIKCVDGITLNKDKCRKNFEQSLGLATVLNPIIGYTKAAEVVKEAIKNKKSIFATLHEKKLFTEKELENLFSPEKLTKPGIAEKK